MSDSELPIAFKFWTHFAEFGCVVVILGIIGEGLELAIKWWKRRKFRIGFGLRFDDVNRARLGYLIRKVRPIHLEIETLALTLVIVGLLIEVAASHVAYGISDLQNATLNNEAAEERLKAAKLEWQIADTQTNVSKIDPTNLPVLSMDAFVKLRVKGNEFPDLTQWDSIPISTNCVAPVRLCDGFPARRLCSATTNRSGDSHEIEPLPSHRKMKKWLEIS
jgi:hypothetical protein